MLEEIRDLHSVLTERAIDSYALDVLEFFFCDIDGAISHVDHPPNEIFVNIIGVLTVLKLRDDRLVSSLILFRSFIDDVVNQIFQYLIERVIEAIHCYALEYFL